jgi:hypothetical protein
VTLDVASCNWSLTKTNITTACYLVIASQLYATFFHKFAFDATMTSTLSKVDKAVDTTTKATIHKPPEEEERLHSVQEGKGPKVQKDRAKRTASDRIKTGRASTHPVILDTAAQRARQANAEPPIRTPFPPPPPPNRFATSSATFPGEGHWENWHPQDPNGQDLQYEKLWSDQWRSASRSSGFQVLGWPHAPPIWPSSIEPLHLNASCAQRAA